jgi:hypothetical protein
MRISGQSLGKWLAAGSALAALGYAGYAAVTWRRYGHVTPPAAGEQDPLLDRFMPTYDVVDRHHVEIAAPAAVTLEVAGEMDLSGSMITRAIFKGRELILGATPDEAPRPRGLLAQVQSLGWGVLADVPGREIVVGAVTRPWEANVTFRAIPPEAFATFSEPDYVKIVWTLRADPVGEGRSVFRTETRAVATDAHARARFRTYWAFLSPGIVIIRHAMLQPLKAEAERRSADRGARAATGVLLMHGR